MLRFLVPVFVLDMVSQNGREVFDRVAIEESRPVTVRRQLRRGIAVCSMYPIIWVTKAVVSLAPVVAVVTLCSVLTLLASVREGHHTHFLPTCRPVHPTEVAVYHAVLHCQSCTRLPQHVLVPPIVRWKAACRGAANILAFLVVAASRPS